MTVNHRAMAAFVLAEICNGFKDGQQTCLEMGLHRTCMSTISHLQLQQHQLQQQKRIDSKKTPSAPDERQLKIWVCLCLAKLCEGFPYAKYLCITEAGQSQLYPLLIDPEPLVRAAAVSGLPLTIIPLIMKGHK